VCRNCHNLSTLKIPPAEFAKRGLLGATAETKFVGNTKFILLDVALKIADIGRYIVA
jgi:hypothetical protein